MDVLNLVAQLRVERSQSGTKSFVPPGIPKQMKGIKSVEAEANAIRTKLARKREEEGVHF